MCTSVSLDGKAWSAPKAIVDANDNQVNPAIAASGQPNGLVAVLWQDDRAGNQDVYMATSTDAFTTAEVTAVTSDEADQTDPAVIIDGEDAIFMRWTDTRNDSTAAVEVSSRAVTPSHLSGCIIFGAPGKSLHGAPSLFGNPGVPGDIA